MQLNPWVLLTSLVLGVIGSWFLFTAFDDYLTATRSYTRVEVAYVEDSFAWQDATFETGTADVKITNNSGKTMTVEYLSLSLAFDGEFAGAWYEDWEPLEIPANESATFTATFTITQNSIQNRGGDAELSMRGRMRLAFSEIEKPLTINLSRNIGQVPWNGQ